MRLTARRVDTMIFATSCVLVILLVILGFQVKTLKQYRDPGVRCVKLMYEFKTPYELQQNQVELSRYLTNAEYKRLNIDNELRVVNTYYKFQYSASKVQIVESGDGYVLYHIINDNVDPNDFWVFLYEQNENGKLTNIREYRLLATGATEVMK